MRKHPTHLNERKKSLNAGTRKFAIAAHYPLKSDTYVVHRRPIEIHFFLIQTKINCAIVNW